MTFLIGLKIRYIAINETHSVLATFSKTILKPKFYSKGIWIERRR